MNNTTPFVHRTLPRELIKWLQGLELSYPVKDYRKDLSNGFLIAQILLRYYPTKLQMHSFENSHRLQRRQNNWTLIQQFFNKNGLAIVRKDWQAIMTDQDPQTLYNFMLKLYPILTQRKIPPQNQAIPQQVTLSKETVSYILKEKGLERIEPGTFGKKVQPHQQNFQEKVGQAKKKNIVNMSYKPISPNLQNLDYQIDVKNVYVRPVGDKLKSKVLIEAEPTSKLEGNKEQKRIIDIESKKRSTEKSICTFLNEMLVNQLSLPEFQPTLRKFQSRTCSQSQYFRDRIGQISDAFSSLFFESIISSRDVFVNYMAKDQHETWHFFVYFFQCFERIQIQSQAFRPLLNLLQTFSQACYEKDPLRTKHIFTEYLMDSLIEQLKTCVYFQKKSEIFRQLYNFFGSDLNSKKHAIVSLKQKLVNNMQFFVQALAVLIRQQKSYNEDNKLMFQEFIFYANVNLFSSSPNLRTMALSMYIHLTDINFQLSTKLLLKKVGKLSNMTWWENRCQVVILFSKLIRSVIHSQKYLNLVKNQSNFHKFFSLQNEKMINQMKQNLDVLSKGIINSVNLQSSNIVNQIFFVNCVDIVAVTRPFTQFLIDMLIDSHQSIRTWVLKARDEVVTEDYLFLSDRSLKYSLNMNSSSLQAQSSEILLRLTDMIKERKIQKITRPMMDILTFCFEHIDFKIMNMQSCEYISNTLSSLVHLSVCDNELCQEGVFVLDKILGLYFHSEIRVKESQQIFSAMVCLILQNNDKTCVQALNSLLNPLIIEATKNNLQVIKKFLSQVRTLVGNKTKGSRTQTQASRLFQQLDLDDQRS